MKAIATSLLIAPLLFLGCSPESADKADKPASAKPESDKETASASVKPQSASPKHFWFDYQFEPSPGKRYWTAVGKTWIEQYESGEYSRFQVVGRETVAETSGTVVAKVAGDPEKTWTGNEGNFQAFIPDIGSPSMKFWFRNKSNGVWEQWRPLSDMQGIE
jgi:hypothetical protein